MAEYVGDFLGGLDAAKILEDGASDYLSKVCGKLISNRKVLVQLIVDCLNKDPKIKACYVTGAGCFVPEELVDPAKEVCQGWIT